MAQLAHLMTATTAESGSDLVVFTASRTWECCMRVVLWWCRRSSHSLWWTFACKADVAISALPITSFSAHLKMRRCHIVKGRPTWYQRNPKEREPLASRDVMKGSCLAAVRTRVSFIAADIGLSWSNSTNERYKEEPVC